MRSPADPGTWSVIKTIRPGQDGSMAEVERYGADLLVVRYRKIGKRTVKTVELLERPGSRGEGVA